MVAKDRDYILDEESDVSSIEAEGMFLDGRYFFGGDFYLKKLSVLLHYIIIFIYIIHIIMCLIHIYSVC